MKKLFTLILLLTAFQISATEKRSKTSQKTISEVGSVAVSPSFAKPKMENLDKVMLDSLFSRPVVQVPSLRKQTKRYRPASAPSLQTKLNWVFAY